MDKEQREQLKTAARVGAVGLEMGIATAVGYFGGGWLDDRFHTDGVLTYVGLGFGIAAGFFGLWRVARSFRPHDDDPEVPSKRSDQPVDGSGKPDAGSDTRAASDKRARGPGRD